MQLKTLVAVCFVSLLLAGGAEAQSPVKDISAVFAEGRVSDGQYKNDYFGLSLTPTGAEFTQGSFLSSQGKRARLVDAEANAKEWKNKFSIAVLADALSVNPLVRSPEQYVRSVRHQLEREGLTTVQEESTIDISGVRFVQATMKTAEGGVPHYQGLYTTFLNGYILSLQVEAPSQERLTQVVRSMVSFKVPHE